MSDLFIETVEASAENYLGEPELPYLDPDYQDYVIPATFDAVDAEVRKMSRDEQRAIADYLLESGKVNPNKLNIETEVTDLDSLVFGLVSGAVLKAIHDIPEVQLRRESNLRMLDTVFAE